MGFDADNQAATLAGLLGVMLGRQGLPNDLLFPVPELAWTKPFNDFYKNVSRYDMPDAGLEDMANRMAAQGEKIILENGGRKVGEDGTDFYLINAEAQFIPPLEFPSGPLPYMEVGQEVDYELPAFGGEAPLNWTVMEGELPGDVQLLDGRVTGTPSEPGVFPIGIQLTAGNGQRLSKSLKLVVRGPNLAGSATSVLSSVRETHAARRDQMWLTVPRSLYADRVEVIRDGKRLGDGSTFYSIEDHDAPKVDFYGYEWGQSQLVGLLGYHTGSVEENGGWFTSLSVEYRDRDGNWNPVHGLLVSPPLAPGPLPFNKPHFVEYLLAFRPVMTTGVRIIGDAGTADHWRSPRTHFTSISEMSAHGPLPNYELLNR